MPDDGANAITGGQATAAQERILPAPEVAVVIPTYRRTDLLTRCLKAVVEQDLEPARYEIIVCDDGPDEETRVVVHTFAMAAEKRDLKIIYVPVFDTQGPAAARNRGWRIARAPVIAFTDDDTVPERSWLSAGLKALREQRATAVAGGIAMPLPENPTDYELDAARLSTGEFATANVFVRRAALQKTGGFDERYTAAWREDSDLQFSLLEAGGVIGRAPEATVVHPIRPARWGVSLSQVRKAQFEALLYKKHPRYYRTRIGTTPWRYYGIVTSVVALLGALAADLQPVALAAFAVWFALTAAFFIKRMRNTRRTPSHIAEMLYTSILIPPLAVLWRLYGAFKYRVGFL